MSNVADNLKTMSQKIAESCRKAGREADGVTLLAVSKTKPATLIREAYNAGQRHFGENYVQEALDKMAHLEDLDICWHFIGPLQSNKTRAVAERFDWFHTLDRSKIADRLNEQRPEGVPPLQVCIQVNIDREDTKSGCLSENCQALAEYVGTLPNLRLRGLMAVPAPGDSQQAFYRLRELQQNIAGRTGMTLDTLSMGMSGDLEQAIAAGATIVRVGTAIFGQRAYSDESPSSVPGRV